MNKLLIAAVCALMTFPAVSAADDDGRASRSPSYRQGGGQQYDGDGGRGYKDGHRDKRGRGHQYNTSGRYPYYVRNAHYYHVRGYAPYYYRPSYPYRYVRYDDDDNDEVLWAIGGLVVGGIIGNAVGRASTPPASPPPQNCDHVAYDSAGNPYVERSCAK